MPVVLDASTVLAWTFVDERDADSRASAQAVLVEGAVVPAIWCWEIQNALLAAERRKRVTASEVATVLRQLGALPIEVEPVGPALAFGLEMDTARRMALSLYDAAYLELGVRRGLKVMTRGAKLGAAADSLRVRWKG
ncbi:MAG: type II toxin-antitoxin system VapC family toxin [Sphingomicrobium sp.]